MAAFSGEDVLYEGFLSKRGHMAPYTWRNRLFLLESRGEGSFKVAKLSYYKGDATDAHPKGTVPLLGAELFVSDPGAKSAAEGSKWFGFAVRTAAGKSYPMRAASAEDREEHAHDYNFELMLQDGDKKQAFAFAAEQNRVNRKGLKLAKQRIVALSQQQLMLTKQVPGLRRKLLQLYEAVGREGLHSTALLETRPPPGDPRRGPYCHSARPLPVPVGILPSK